MLFEKVKGESEKIRVEDPKFWTKFKWVTMSIGSQIDLSEDRGLMLGYDPIIKKPKSPKKKDNSKKEKPKEKKEEPKIDSKLKKKQVELYKQKLEDIKGIGKKTAKDIIRMYPKESDLIKALNNGKEIPIRDDLAKILKKKFK